MSVLPTNRTPLGVIGDLWDDGVLTAASRDESSRRLPTRLAVTAL